MQRQQSTSRVHPSSVSRDEAFALNADESPRDQGVSYNQDEPYAHETPREETQEPGLRSQPSFRVILGSVVLGVVLAIAWRYTDVQALSARQWWPVLAMQRTEITTKREEQLARITEELQGLKQRTGELGATQRQIAASIASLQAAQQEIERRMSSAPAIARWYSDPALLNLRVPASIKSTGTSSQDVPRPHARAGANADARGGHAPLSLVAPER